MVFTSCLAGWKGPSFRQRQKQQTQSFHLLAVQALWVFMTILPIHVSNFYRHISQQDPPSWNAVDSIGLAVWVIGFAIEIISDHQKCNFRTQNRGSKEPKWICTGLRAWVCLKPAFALLLPDDETSQLFAPPQLLWRSSCFDWRCSDVLLHNDALGLYCSAVRLSLFTRYWRKWAAFLCLKRKLKKLWGANPQYQGTKHPHPSCSSDIKPVAVFELSA